MNLTLNSVFHLYASKFAYTYKYPYLYKSATAFSEIISSAWKEFLWFLNIIILYYFSRIFQNAQRRRTTGEFFRKLSNSGCGFFFTMYLSLFISYSLIMSRAITCGSKIVTLRMFTMYISKLNNFSNDS